MKKNQSKFLSCLIATLAGGAMAASPGLAATMFTDLDGADSAITTAGNWDNGLPDNSGNSGTVSGAFATTNASEQGLDSTNITFEGTSSLTSTSAGVKVEDSTTTFKDSSFWSQDGTIAIGRDQPDEGGNGAPTGVSILNIQDTASVSMTGDFKVARGQNAFVNQSGGTVTTGTANGDQINLGNNSKGGVGAYTLSGGTATAGGMSFQNGSIFDFTLGSTGVLTILNTGVDYTTNFETFVTNGDITLGGASAAVGDFLITFDSGVSTSIQLVPEPTAMLLSLLGASLIFARRTRS